MNPDIDSKPTEDLDIDDDGDLDVEHFPIPAGLLQTAEIVDDDEWDTVE